MKQEYFESYERLAKDGTVKRISSREVIKYSWAGLNDDQLERALSSASLLDLVSKRNLTHDILSVMKMPEYLFWTSKILLGLDMLPIHALIQEELWKRQYPMLIMTRGGAKSFSLAQYALLKLRLVPGTKMVVCGAGFRQSKIIFEYMEKIWLSADVYRSTCTQSDGPRMAPDRGIFRVGDSQLIAIPIGHTGHKVRGLRANCTIADEFNCVSSDTLVNTNQGIMTIRETFNCDGIKLINMYGKLEEPERFIRTPEPVDVYFLELENGAYLRCSRRHKVMTSRGWEYVRNLKKGDLVEIIGGYSLSPWMKMQEGLLRPGEIDEIPIRQYGAPVEVPDKIMLESYKNIKYYLGRVFDEVGFHNAAGFGLRFSSREAAMRVGLLLRLINVDFKLSLRENSKQWELYIKRSHIRHFLRAVGRIEHPAKGLPHTETSRYSAVRVLRLEEEKEYLYDYYLPRTNSFYTNGILSHNSIPPDIYETVIAGFGAVSQDPVKRAKFSAKRNKMIQLGVWTEENENEYLAAHGNQQILSGTCGYSFEHFAKYWDRYRSIIRSRGDHKKLQEIMGDDIDFSAFNWRDYSVIRIPFNLMPKDFMDESTIMRGKATLESDSYDREYGTIFSKDSDGFFKRTLINSCVADEKNNITINGQEITFSARMVGDPNLKYIIGLDPASERDNLAIVVLELHPDHTRVVHCWTINNKRHKEKVDAGIVSIHNYFQYCAQKVRDLMKVFPTVRIMMDGQGGGVTFREAFADPPEGEIRILEVIDPDKEKITDNMQGYHILEICQNSNSKWLAEANNGLKIDLESKHLLFPKFDAVELAMATNKDDEAFAKSSGLEAYENIGLYDTYEDLLMEIENLKDELTKIKHTKTSNGTDRWDTASVKVGGKVVKNLKDRYSALFMANMGARQMTRALVAPPMYSVIGIRAGQKVEGGDFYTSKGHGNWYDPSVYEGIRKIKKK